MLGLRVESRAESLCNELERSFLWVARALKVVVAEVETGTGRPPLDLRQPLHLFRSRLGSLWRSFQNGTPSESVLQAFDGIAEEWALLPAPWARQRSLLAWQLRERDGHLELLAGLRGAWTGYELAATATSVRRRRWSTLCKWVAEMEGREGEEPAGPRATEYVKQLCTLVLRREAEGRLADWTSPADMIRDLARETVHPELAEPPFGPEAEKVYDNVRKALSNERGRAAWMVPPVGLSGASAVAALVERFKSLASEMS